MSLGFLEVTGKTYRLLSEAEWEYAAQAGASTLYSFGDDKGLLPDYAWYQLRTAREPHSVGEKKPNAIRPLRHAWQCQ